MCLSKYSFVACTELYNQNKQKGLLLTFVILFYPQIYLLPFILWSVTHMKMGWFVSFLLTNLEQVQDKASPDVQGFKLQTLLLPSAWGPGWNLGVQSIRLQRCLRLQLHGTAALGGRLQPSWAWPWPAFRGQRQQWSGSCQLTTQHAQEHALSPTSRGRCGNEEQQVQWERGWITWQWKPWQWESWERESWPWLGGQFQQQQQGLSTAGVFWEQQKVKMIVGMMKPLAFSSVCLCE